MKPMIDCVYVNLALEDKRGLKNGVVFKCQVKGDFAAEPQVEIRVDEVLQACVAKFLHCGVAPILEDSVFGAQQNVIEPFEEENTLLQ